MNARTRAFRHTMLLAAAIGLLIDPIAAAKGGKGGHPSSHPGGHTARAPRPPRMSAPKTASHPPRMAHASAPARVKTSGANAQAKHASQANHNAQVAANRTAGARKATASASQSRASRGIATRNTYTYGQGANARHYRAYGYGRGSRNRHYGNGYGYGRSQGSNRAIVSRLRSVQSGLARIDHDYQGHRVRAMHATSMAIRQLTHRSMVYRGVGFSMGVNNGMAQGMRRGNAGRNQADLRPMSQAQSDNRMAQALRGLQGVHMQIGNQGYVTTSLSRARGHVQVAVGELNRALAIR